MPQTDVTPIARQFIQAWNAGQRDVVDDLAAPDLTVAYPHFPEPLEGPDAFKEMLVRLTTSSRTSRSRWTRFSQKAIRPPCTDATRAPFKTGKWAIFLSDRSFRRLR